MTFQVICSPGDVSERNVRTGIRDFSSGFNFPSSTDVTGLVASEPARSDDESF